MAKTLPRNSISFLFISFIILVSSTLLATAKSHPFARSISRKALGLKKERFTHLHFYFQDVVDGKNITAYPIARSQVSNSSKTAFGLSIMMDDPLTVAFDSKSKVIGWAQGIYASASRSELSLLMALTLTFTEGKYNGSSLSILGRNSIYDKVREMPIVGGSGIFRFARGYALAETVFMTKVVAIVEYNVYVSHYR